MPVRTILVGREDYPQGLRDGTSSMTKVYFDVDKDILCWRESGTLMPIKWCFVVRSSPHEYRKNRIFCLSPSFLWNTWGQPDPEPYLKKVLFFTPNHTHLSQILCTSGFEE